VERILRAARAGEIFKVIVFIPAVPGFVGTYYPYTQELIVSAVKPGQESVVTKCPLTITLG